MKIRFAKSDISEGLIISSGFVDEHMISANGEFVKVYLFLVRRAGREVELWEIADALHMLESDVGRALKYWKSKGVLTVEETPVLPESPSFLREEKEDSFRQETEAAREEPPVSFEREKGEESDQEESAGERAIKESCAGSRI